MAQNPAANHFVLLDIDGVLLPIGKDIPGEPWDAFPQSCMSHLSRIIAETGATIVLSSTWRATEDSKQHIINEFKRFSATHGGPLGFIEEFEHTTSLTNYSVRQWEVAEWVLNYQSVMSLSSLKTKNNMKLSKKQHSQEEQRVDFTWVALDDDTSLTEDPRYLTLCSNNTIQTNCRIGLTNEDAEKAIEILLPNQQKIMRGE